MSLDPLIQAGSRVLCRVSYRGEFVGTVSHVDQGHAYVVPDDERPDRTGCMRIPGLDGAEVLGIVPRGWLAPWGRQRCQPQRLWSAPDGVLRYDGRRWWVLNHPDRGWASSGYHYASVGEALARWSLTMACQSPTDQNLLEPAHDQHGPFWPVREVAS